MRTECVFVLFTRWWQSFSGWVCEVCFKGNFPSSKPIQFSWFCVTLMHSYIPMLLFDPNHKNKEILNTILSIQRQTPPTLSYTVQVFRYSLRCNVSFLFKVTISFLCKMLIFKSSHSVNKGFSFCSFTPALGPVLIMLQPGKYVGKFCHFYVQ